MISVNTIGDNTSIEIDGDYEDIFSELLIAISSFKKLMLKISCNTEEEVDDILLSTIKEVLACKEEENETNSI